MDKSVAAQDGSDQCADKAVSIKNNEATSNGSVLIYGIRENQVNKYLPGDIDPLDRKTE